MDEALGVLKEYISMENVFFIPFLVFAGRCLKKSRRIDDTAIPTVLGALGVGLCGLVSLVNNTPQNAAQWILMVVVSIGQGVCVAGAAVFLNQWFKQQQKYKSMKTFDPPEGGRPIPRCGSVSGLSMCDAEDVYSGRSTEESGVQNKKNYTAEEIVKECERR